MSNEGVAKAMRWAISVRRERRWEEMYFRPQQFRDRILRVSGPLPDGGGGEGEENMVF